MKEVKMKYPLRGNGYSTRAAQSILQYGVGAMVDFPDQTLMTAAPEYWEETITRIYDPRLEKSLKVKYFGMPGTKDGNSSTKDGISYVRFPEWYFCPKCRSFKPLKEWIEDYKKYAPQKMRDNDSEMFKKPMCYQCYVELVASNIITVCPNGHINDFPWVAWAHLKSIPRKQICAHPRLKFQTGTSAAEGLQGLVVRCENCGATATLKEAFYQNVFKEAIEKGDTEFKCQGRHPWKGTRDNCPADPITKQRGDTSVYYPCSVSSIVIPTNADENVDRIIGTEKYRSVLEELDECDDEQEKKDLISKRIDKWADKISSTLMMRQDIVKNILLNLLSDNQDDSDDDTDVDSIEYRYEEYRALAGIDKIKQTSDFAREETNISDYKIPGLKQVVLIKKLREVRAQVGFSRVEPVEAHLRGTPGSGFVEIKEDDTEWYPGYEVKGEGIFIEFDQDKLDNLKESNFARVRMKQLLDNCNHSFMRGRLSFSLDAEYVFLHTMAHLLLKQLSFECGYNIASLRERLYYAPSDTEEKMCGILLYTASGDSEGTLGGLTRQGRSDCLPRIFKEAVDKARFCSNDPGCITSQGQGRDGLNLAACHACSLIPETSCEQLNIFLDRALIIGTFEEPDAGFYSSWEKDYSVRTKDNKHTQNANKNSTEIAGEENLGVNRIRVLDAGQSQEDSTYEEIWNYIKADTDQNDEKKLFDELIDKSIGRYEKPIYSGEINILGEVIPVDLIWKKSKVLFFLSENASEYDKAKDNGWKCYCLAKQNIDIVEFLKRIEDR